MEGGSPRDVDVIQARKPFALSGLLHYIQEFR